MNKTIGKYELVSTCGSHPEQYDVLLDGKQVGYLRLRHGSFRVDCPEQGGETVFRSEPRGDGEFEDDEREIHLNAAVASIDAYLSRNPVRSSELVVPPQAGMDFGEWVRRQR